MRKMERQDLNWVEGEGEEACIARRRPFKKLILNRDWLRSRVRKNCTRFRNKNCVWRFSS